MAGLEGARLGAYELVERIGSGGMAEVYRAKQLTAFGREVAVKVIRQDFSEDKLFRERFLREAQAIAKLSHPNILPLIEFGEQDDLLYLVMPYAPGGTLRDLMQRVGGPLPLKDALEIFTQLCDAVQYAHEQGIFHRDIKPQNVLIQRGKHLLLADFGIARDAASEQKLTSTGAGVGTVEYMAPEQAMGRGDARSDLYSLAIVLYQMLTGRVPFSGNTPFEIMMKQANQPLQPARLLNPTLPREVDGILEMALAKDPGKRFQSAGALLRAAQGLLQPARGGQAGADPGARVGPHALADLETRLTPDPGPLPFARSGPSSSSRPASPGFGSNPGQGAPSAQSWGGAPSRSSRHSGEPDRYEGYGATPPGSLGGRSYDAPPAEPYDDSARYDATYAADAPPRRPTNPHGGAPRRSGTRPPGSSRPEMDLDNAPRRGNKWLLVAAVVLVIAALAVGGLAYAKYRSGSTAASSPTAGSGTPGVGATPTATQAPPAKPSYAFLRNYQVFVSVQGQAPRQMTNIPGMGQPNSALGAGVNYDFLASPFVFSPDGRYIACLIQVVNAPSDAFLGGNLYLIDTTTGAVTQPTEPGSSKKLFSQGGENALAWQDSQTLLIAGDPSTSHVRAYHVKTDSFTVAIAPASGQVGSVIVRGHFVYYSVQTPVSGSSNNNVILHRYDLNAKTDKQLFTLGQVSPPQQIGPAPNGYAPFDISPDGTHILWEGIPSGSSAPGIWYSNVDGSAATQLLGSVDLSQDMPFLQSSLSPLSLSPDGKAALFAATTAVYTLNVDGSNQKTYAYAGGQGAWLPDSSGVTIALNTTPSASAATYKSFQCAASTGACSAFEDNAYPLYWALP